MKIYLAKEKEKEKNENILAAEEPALEKLEKKDNGNRLQIYTFDR